MTRNLIKLLIALSISSLVPACASKERVYENLYEGLQHRERLVNPSEEDVPTEHRDYKDYKREREKALNKN